MRPEHWLYTIPLRLRSLFRWAQADQELDEELRDHLERKTEEYIAQGMTLQGAHRRAQLDLEGFEQTKEKCRDERRVNWIPDLIQDIRYGLRTLRNSPGFTAVAVLTLALGIGANTVIFSAVYALLLKPLPFKGSDRLVFIVKKNPPRGWIRNPISPAEILAWRDQSGAFEDIAAYTQRTCVLTGGPEAEEDPCEVVSSNMFPILNMAPIRGRPFSVEEDEPQGPRVAILSYRLWQRRFAGDENVIGRAFDVNGNSYSIVGIMPSNFSHLYASPYGELPELWLSGIGLSPSLEWNDYFGIGRLKPGISLGQAEARMNIVSERIEQMHKGLKGWRAQVMTLRTNASGDTRPALLVLMGAVNFVLLIACANVANLLLARGSRRASEFALRNALGADQSRIIRQLLTESLVLSVAGGVLGVLLASWGCKGLVALAPPLLLKSAPGLAGGATDLRVLAFALAAVVATTFFFGLAPALQSARSNVTETLKETGHSALQSPHSRRFGNALVVAETALAMVLLIGAGLMVRTLAGLSRLDLGFNPENVLTLRVPLSGERYKEPQVRAQFWENVLSAVESLPGVESASVSRGLPITGWDGQFFTTLDDPNPPAGQIPAANYVVISPDYFRTVEIPLRRGRSFNDHDTQSGEKVVIVNEELARSYWPGQDPLGKQLQIGGEGPWRTVVGIAGDVLSQGPGAGFNPEMYIPYQQFPWLMDGPKHLIVRTSATVKPESLVRAVTREIHRVDKSQPVADIATMEEITLESIKQERMVTALLASFAGLALALSALGIYGVLSYSIAQRTREIGLRLALGADRGSVLRLVVGSGARLAILGIVAGTAMALILTRLMTGLLYGVRPADPVTFGVVTFVMAATSILACYIPARRATRVDPIVALRYE
jgi:putative ABC transport system permease protein